MDDDGRGKEEDAPIKGLSPVFTGSHGLPTAAECGRPPKPWRKRTEASAGYAVGEVLRTSARGSIFEGGLHLEVKKDRRKVARRAVTWPVTIVADYGTIEGEIKNITVDGILIHSEDPLRLNEIYRMSIMPPNHVAIGVTGKVVWSDAYCMDEDNSVFGIGVCLIEISPQDRESLSGLLKEPKSSDQSAGG